ncbi:MAG: insulinase family protein [Hyphomicrobiaceae bacterium]|nr:insulinase family protein [Hyphomicrobiaceae bacterium]
MTVSLPVDKLNAASKVSHFKLKNGLEVVVIPDHRAPVVTHMVWYRVGAADEPPGVSGIAHFLEHLMFKGTDKIAPGEFSKIIARNGGEDNAFTGHDATAYFQRVAKDRLPLVMEMEADRMVNLKLLEKDVATERKVILEERRSRVENDPSNILGEQMHAALYQSHPYGIPILGWEHEMRALDRKKALDFYERYYAPNNAILIVAGDVTGDEVKKLAEQTYGKIKPSNDRVRDARPIEPKHRAPIRVNLEDPRAGRATVQRMYLAPSYSVAEPGEAEALDLMVKVLASGSTSRLYKNLVVDRKIAASAGGWFSGTGLDSGRLGVYAVASDGADIADVEKAVDEVIADFIENGATQKELDRARNSYIASHVYGGDSQSRLARRYGWGLVNGRTIADIEAWPERLKKVTVEDLQHVAKKYFDKSQSVTGVLRPVDVKNAGSKKAKDGKKKS